VECQRLEYFGIILIIKGLVQFSKPDQAEQVFVQPKLNWLFGSQYQFQSPKLIFRTWAAKLECSVKL